jgi:hypothetical protein
MKEIWRPIRNYEDLYEISNFFKVRDLCDDNKLIRRLKEKRGLYVTLSKLDSTSGKFVSKDHLVEYLFNSSFESDGTCRIPQYNIDGYNKLLKEHNEST